ncbi:hypothetical protein D4Q52_13110 [Rhodopseudomonas palustris]|uniref:Uncharacterized protein n=1 Tax=Rhodopseudomonas palustris TaxID=1076 RepID=A0A418VD73_RHOPL|nr:hypothetical protein D4Q52_13110 [Rhodopseudomonas palustris]
MFSAWLLHPYFDLEPTPFGPLHARCVEHGWRAFDDLELPRFTPQRALAPGFRVQLARTTGQRSPVIRPHDLPARLRSERWGKLCGAIDGWNALLPEKRVRLAFLLHSLCFYSQLIDLVDGREDHGLGADPVALELDLLCASARYIAAVPKQISDYHDADLSKLERIAGDSRAEPRTRFNSTAKVFVHKAKTRADTSELVRWGARFEACLGPAVADMDEFSANLHISRFYRGMGFLPQRAGDAAAVARAMGLAEDYAFRMRPVTPAQQVLFKENLHALMQSRAKEAAWAGDLDLALTRALQVIEFDPCDSMAWLELGQLHRRRKSWPKAAEAFAVAAMLGPPAAAVGRHLVGVCLSKIGLDLLAALFFRDALEADPLGISPRRAIENLPDAPVLVALKEWLGSQGAGPVDGDSAGGMDIGRASVAAKARGAPKPSASAGLGADGGCDFAPPG